MRKSGLTVTWLLSIKTRQRKQTEGKLKPDKKRIRVQPSSLLGSRKKGIEGREEQGKDKFNRKDMIAMMLPTHQQHSKYCKP